jgi:hypothetical protein
MADFAAELSKIVSDRKALGKTKKKLSSKTSAVLGQGVAGSSSPGGASSSLGASKVVSPAAVQMPKRQRQDVPVVDLEVEKPFLLPRVISDKDFLVKNPLQVAAVEKVAILGMDSATCREQLIEDSAGLLRLLETALVLNDDRGSQVKDLEVLREANEKLSAENMKLENEVIDLRGTQENFVAQIQENRELRTALDRAVEDRKKLEEEIGPLRLALVPGDDETESTRGLTSRAELVARVRKLGDEVFNGVKHGWKNAIAQIKVANPGVDINLEGTGMLREVVDGQIVIPEKYQNMDLGDLEGDDDMDVDEEEEEEDGHEHEGESHSTTVAGEDA